MKDLTGDYSYLWRFLLHPFMYAWKTISSKMAAYWDVAPCSLVDIDQHFRGAFFFLHQGDDSLFSIYQTAQCNIRKDSHLCIYHFENLKSQPCL
jgi:hypothetical protein